MFWIIMMIEGHVEWKTKVQKMIRSSSFVGNSMTFSQFLTWEKWNYSKEWLNKYDERALVVSKALNIRKNSNFTIEISFLTFIRIFQILMTVFIFQINRYLRNVMFTSILFFPVCTNFLYVFLRFWCYKLNVCLAEEKTNSR